jgi:hypothetical protein
MPRVQIPITDVAETGTAQPSVTAGDSTNDHYLAGGGDVLVECKNTSGGALSVTFVTPYVSPGGIGLEDNVVSVNAGAVKLVKIAGAAVRRQYEQTTDSDRIYVDITSNSWEFRAYGI